jgi:hypothetical protein
LAARSEPRLPVIASSGSPTPQDSATFLSAFRRGLAESSYIEGQNVAIEARFASNQVDRLPILMAEFVSMHVSECTIEIFWFVSAHDKYLYAKAARCVLNVFRLVLGVCIRRVDQNADRRGARHHLVQIE